jgi:hypothetical protein
MRWLLLALSLLLVRPASALTDAVWTNPPPVYTNLLGQELCTEIWLRDRWAGGTNWWFSNTVSVTYSFSNAITTRDFTNGAVIFSRSLTNQVALTTNVVATNVFGSPFVVAIGGTAVTGVVPFEATGAERLTDKLDSLMAAYVWPWFSDVSQAYSFDAWWTNGIDRWPGTLFPKAELMNQHTGVCGIATYSDGGTNVFIAVQHEGFDELLQEGDYTPAGWWIKRLNRIDPLIVAEWSRWYNWNYDPAYTPPGLPDGLEWQYYEGWQNEFTRGDSQLFGIDESQHPVFIVHLGGTNEYVSGSLYLTFRMDDPDGVGPTWMRYWDWASNFRAPYVHPLTAEWVSNYLHSYEMVDLFDPYPAWATNTIVLNSTTQRATRAWLALGVPLVLKGDAPNIRISTNMEVYPIGGATITNYFVRTNSSDVVSLQYTNRMTTYEGIKAWDGQLHKEQFTAHLVAFTNMVLTPWTNWVWTNSFGYAYSTNINVAWTNSGDIPWRLELYGNAHTYWSEFAAGEYTQNGSTWTLDGASVPTTITQISASEFRLHIDHYGFNSWWTSTNGLTGLYYPDGGYSYDTAQGQRKYYFGASTNVASGMSTNYNITTNRYPQPLPDLWWWIDIAQFPLFSEPWVVTGNGPAACGNAPASEYFSLISSGGVQEVWDAFTYDVSEDDEPVEWGVSAYTTNFPITISAVGSGVVSSVAVEGLCTETRHRVHLYAVSPLAMIPLGTSPYYHRIYLSDWTTNPTVVCDPIDPRQTNTWAVSLTNEWYAWSNAGPITVENVNLVPYLNVTDSSQLSTNYTDVAYANETNWVTNGWTWISSTITTNLDGVDWILAEMTPVFDLVYTNYPIGSNTICGWSQPYDLGEGEGLRLKIQPQPYSWGGYAASNAVASNAAYAGTNIVLNLTNGMPYYVQAPGFTLAYCTNALYSDGSSFLQLNGSTWELYDSLSNRTHIHGSLTGSYEPVDTNNEAIMMYALGGGPGGPQEATINYGDVKVSTNAYDTLVGTGFEKAMDYGADPAYQFTGIFGWRAYDINQWYNLNTDIRYIPNAISGTTWIDVAAPTVRPDTTDVIIGYSTTHWASEWLSASTNWSSSVGIKVLVEWQR